MSQRTQTWLIVGITLTALLIYGLVSGQLQEILESMGAVWDALF